MSTYSERDAYPSDVSDEEWSFVAPYLTLMRPDAPQRDHDLREVFNGLRWIVRTGSGWRYMPHDLPPWYTVYQQTQRWIRAGVFEEIVHDLRVLIRLGEGKTEQPTAAIFDARTLPGSIENGERGGYDGHKKRKGTKLHLAVDTLGEVLALAVTPANVDEREQVRALAEAVQEATGDSVEVVFADQGYTGPGAEDAAASAGMRLEVVRLPAAKRGFVLLPRRWVVERSFAWVSRFRRLAKDYERLPETVAGLHLVAFSILMLARMVKLLLAGSA
ncbi:MAG: IS5 family transposase [Chloroflexi bacterium]|nr:MAG: IS5 family transposase [Chloroflexota bacterium]